MRGNGYMRKAKITGIVICLFFVIIGIGFFVLERNTEAIVPAIICGIILVPLALSLMRKRRSRKTSLSETELLYKDLNVERYEIVVTLDDTTCEVCGKMDKKVFELKSWREGVTAPPFHDGCRCATAPYFEDETGERWARGTDGKGYYVPGNMTYAEWKETR